MPESKTSKKRILVVDDSPSITEFLKVKLEATGAYEVRTEQRGDAALQAARLFAPHLILLDIMMPGTDMDGGDVLAALREDPRLASIPIVFLTATVKKEETQGDSGMTISGWPVLAKPVNMQEVLAHIEKFLGKPG